MQTDSACMRTCTCMGGIHGIHSHVHAWVASMPYACHMHAMPCIHSYVQVLSRRRKMLMDMADGIEIELREQVHVHTCICINELREQVHVHTCTCAHVYAHMDMADGIEVELREQVHVH